MNNRFYREWPKVDFTSFEHFEGYVNNAMKGDALILFASSEIVCEFRASEDMRFWFEYASVVLQEKGDEEKAVSMIIEIEPYAVKWLRELLDGFGETPTWVNVIDGKPVDVFFGMPVIEEDVAKEIAEDLGYDLKRLEY